jgi:hypothetical protein
MAGSPVECVKRNSFRSLIASLIIAMALLRAIAGARYNDWPAGDEYWHYSYSERLINTGETERESIPNYISTTPATILNVATSRLFQRLHVVSGFTPFVARIPQLLWYAALLLSVLLFCRRFFDPVTAFLATVLTSTDEGLLAHATLIGTDLPFACAFLWCVWANMNYYFRPSTSAALIVAVALGVAFSAKYLAVFALPFWLYCLLFSQHRLNPVARIRRQLFDAGLAFCIVILIVNLTYGFQRVGTTASSHSWRSGPFKTLATTLPDFRIPLPQAFLSGFDHQAADERNRAWNVVLLGTQYPNGVWFYYFVVWACKLHLASLVCSLVGLVFLIKRFRSWQGHIPTLLLVCGFVALFAYFSFVFRTQVGQRYTLMCLPLFFVLASIGLSQLAAQRFLILGLLISLLNLIEALPFIQNPIAFTNVLIQPKRTTYRVLADSNIDWFHNYSHAKAEARIALGTYAFDPPHMLPGKNVFSLNRLAGVMRNRAQYQWVRDTLEPVRHFAFTTFLFDVSDKEFADYIDAERTVPAIPSGSPLCIPEFTYVPLPSTGTVEVGGSPRRNKVETLCLELEEDALFQVNVRSGFARIGRYSEEHRCYSTEVRPGQSLYWRLKAGMHGVCIEVPEHVIGEFKNPSSKVKYALRYIQQER